MLSPLGQVSWHVVRRFDVKIVWRLPLEKDKIERSREGKGEIEIVVEAFNRSVNFPSRDNPPWPSTGAQWPQSASGMYMDSMPHPLVRSAVHSLHEVATVVRQEH